MSSSMTSSHMSLSVSYGSSGSSSSSTCPITAKLRNLLAEHGIFPTVDIPPPSKMLSALSHDCFCFHLCSHSLSFFVVVLQPSLYSAVVFFCISVCPISHIQLFPTQFSSSRLIVRGFYQCIETTIVSLRVCSVSTPKKEKKNMNSLFSILIKSPVHKSLPMKTATPSLLRRFVCSL